ncbi:MAG: MerR family transcriptional regulator [Acidobacteria bacterium]|nr:MerR family transcriptional regulator [Acidobacteriota bacterium]
MTIGELAAKGGLPASTIRYYEQIGILPLPSRIGGKRVYKPDAVHLLSVVRLAQACGFRLDEIRELVRGFPPRVPASERWRQLANRKRDDLEAQIAKLRAMQHVVERVLQCQCCELAECGRMAERAMEMAT